MMHHLEESGRPGAVHCCHSFSFFFSMFSMNDQDFLGQGTMWLLLNLLGDMMVGKVATAGASSLNREFGSKLKEHMEYCVDNPEEINKLAKVKAQVSEFKGVTMENIEKVLDRGEKIELLVDKTEILGSQV